MSADGTKVAFYLLPPTWTRPTPTSIHDIYVKDLVTGDITLASTSDSGVKGNSYSFDPQLSADGTKVAFCSYATNLDPADTDVYEDVYVKDLVTGDITLATTSDDGVKGNGTASPTVIGRRHQGGVLLHRHQPGPGRHRPTADIYVKDLVTGNITLASTSDSGVKCNGEHLAIELVG